MFALLDCNNFYASCERLFRPDLRNHPIVVLSSNDGCVIARSNEAKDLGIGMGIPFFKVKTLCKQHNVQIFSSNFTLYGDISQRVMSVIEAHWPHVEIYSIDEAFLDLSSLPENELEIFCSTLQKTILRCTGIPTSIGIGASKTLAKTANYIAKSKLKIPVFNINQQRQWLQKISVGDIWGVGRKLHKKLTEQGIYTAMDLAEANPHHMKNLFTVMLQRTVMELNGTRCANLTVKESQHSIISSRSFGVMQAEYEVIAQAVSFHCRRSCEKLREHRLLAQHVTVFVYSNRFRNDLEQYDNWIEMKLAAPTDDLRQITHYAKLALQKIHRNGIQYKKVGIRLGDLVARGTSQLDLFLSASAKEREKTEQFMGLMDKINAKFGRQTIRLAAEGCQQPWAALKQLKSPNYTTQWSELPLVRC
ncbi:Y-family DNA polymerase [Legionella septentrionalis]|uniref:Y-family DNA polymerase n=1 Tax=Legionella septentrionalis TaxID=2498109 RepID=UPI000F8E1105|nr:Y-family DNA polymerase [Legionella septentrionalis]RUR11759.1 Y-family DNA polymerase [Legionella septentrionalis]